MRSFLWEAFTNTFFESFRASSNIYFCCDLARSGGEDESIPEKRSGRLCPRISSVKE